MEGARSVLPLLTDFCYNFCIQARIEVDRDPPDVDVGRRRNLVDERDTVCAVTALVSSSSLASGVTEVQTLLDALPYLLNPECRVLCFMSMPVSRMPTLTLLPACRR